MVQSSRTQRFHTGPTVFRDPNAPPRPRGIITLLEDYKGRNVVEFSTVPLALKRTRGRNKRGQDHELLSNDKGELDTTKSHGALHGRTSEARLNVPTGKLKSPSLSQSKGTARGTKISKTMLSKRGPDVKEAMTPAERKRKQRSQQKVDQREKNAFLVRMVREKEKKDKGESSEPSWKKLIRSQPSEPDTPTTTN